MTNLIEASRQWASRPDDERFLSLTDMQAHFETIRAQSRGAVVSSRQITVAPDETGKGLAITGQAGVPYAPTNWAFGQLATLAGAPAGYLRRLPAPMAADCLNYGLSFDRDIEDVGILLQKNGSNILRAATGPRYGRIWNSDVLGAVVSRFGDGRSGYFKVPGEFGQDVEITKANTTLYAGDRDMFIFLADEKNRIEIPNRRDGKAGALARGFFVWNSEVGSAVFGLATFLFDYVCCNRIVWGAENVSELRIRHTVSAPDKFLEEIEPALVTYANSSTTSITDAIAKARDARLGDKLDDFLATRFGARQVASLKAIHELEEGRPIETLWDVTMAVTAKARSITYQDERVALERQAGDILKLAT
jgi:hypothetical protein